MKRVKQVEIDNTHYTLHQDNRRLVIFEQECLGGRPIANFCTQENDKLSSVANIALYFSVMALKVRDDFTFDAEEQVALHKIFLQARLTDKVRTEIALAFFEIIVGPEEVKKMFQAHHKKKVQTNWMTNLLNRFTRRS